MSGGDRGVKWVRRGLKVFAAVLIFGLCVWWGTRIKQVFSGVEVWQPKLILDAGHGGEDGGAISLSGEKESEINLSVTLKLENLLAFLGEPALLMRDTDISLHDADSVTLREKKVSDLKNRVRIAGEYPAAVLVSIHQNSYPEQKYHGTQVFYAPTNGSEQLAQVVQQAMRKYLQPENKRTEKKIPDNVYLMNHIGNTAILVECGFLTNPEEEQLLQQESYQRKVALVLGSTLTENIC